MTERLPFDIDAAMRLIETAVAPYPKAAMFALAEQGYSTLFEQLVGCVISIRTRDEVSLPTAQRLFARARTPQQLLALSLAEIERLIRTSTFHENKARTIRAIAQKAAADYDGSLPCDRELLLSFKGVGPKCANLALGIACDAPFISVDIHVHRISNRWGYIAAKTPEKSMAALEKVLPRAYWIDINRLLVPFGKHICTANRPRCSVCPLRGMCARVGVTTTR